MKFLIVMPLVFSFFSCNEVSDKDSSNIEFLLGTNLNVKYEIENIETPFDFAHYFISFDLNFRKKEFEKLLKNVDLNKFDTIDYSDLKLTNRIHYYKEYISEKENI